MIINGKSIFTGISLAVSIIFSVMFVKVISHDGLIEYKKDCPNIVPVAALRTILFYKDNREPPRGFGKVKHFVNNTKVLPKKNEQGKKIQYFRMAIYPSIKNINRGSRRVIVGANDKFYYTYDHYKHLIPITDLCLKNFKNEASRY